MALDPGTIISLITLGYSGAVQAWTIFGDALSFPKDSEDIVVRLELERWRFQTWGRNVGLTQGGTFPTALLPIHNLIQDRLNLIRESFENADNLKSSFGLEAVRSDDDAQQSQDKVKILADMARSMNISLPRSEGQVRENKVKGFHVNMRWALRSKTKFENLLVKLETAVNKLNDLLTESQQRSASEDWKRLGILLAGNVKTENSLRLLLDAVPREPHNSPLRSLLDMKAVDIQGDISSRFGPNALRPLYLRDFAIPTTYSTLSRFVAELRTPPRTNQPKELFLFERKTYDSNIDPEDKELLRKRMDRIVLLLSAPNKSKDFCTLRTIGYCDDPRTFSWWLVFHFLDPNASQTRGHEPLSLNTLFSLDFKPPLEQRLQLASKLVTTFGELYGSGWLHKNIRSDNILFPQSYNLQDQSSISKYDDITTPFVAGFDFSRQDSEARTIDKGKTLKGISSAIYRHPNYQGEAATGYKFQYDVYSVGLVLAEIAWWVPLLSFLDAVIPPSTDPSASASASVDANMGTNPVPLSSKMKYFHRAEALALRRIVLLRIDHDLAFRVGTTYCNVVKWCLNFADSNANDGKKNGEQEGRNASHHQHPALEFYNHVVMPLKGFLAA